MDLRKNSGELVESDFFNSIFSDNNSVEILNISNPMKHVLSHRVIFAQFITIEIPQQEESLNQFIQVALNDMDKFAVSRLMELFLENEMELNLHIAFTNNHKLQKEIIEI